MKRVAIRKNYQKDLIQQLPVLNAKTAHIKVVHKGVSFIRLCFIDVDGVLVLQNWGTPYWDTCSVYQFKRFLKACPDVKLVLSSTWRTKPDLIYAFMNMIYADSFLNNEVIGMTPVINLLSRDEEIITYLNKLAEARLLLNIEDYVKDWVAVDDAPEFYNKGLIKDTNIEFVNRSIGFTADLADKLIKRFGGK